MNTLTADNVANTWTISGADTGTVTGIGGTFSHIANLTGGSNDDAFTVGASGSVSGLIDGGAQVGSDTLDYSAVTAAVTTKIGTNFTNIESVTGDGINDTLVGADVANTWTVTGANAGTVGGVAFNGFSNLTGGTNTDGFTLSGGTLSGAIDGGLTGANTLIADNVANTWTITGADAGTVTGIGSFTNIANLTGGTGDDSFVIADAGSLTGSIAGGGQTTSDTLNLSAKLGAVSINQQTSTATGIAGTFGGVEAVVGNGVNATLTGVDAGETFNVTGGDSGTAGSLAFSGVGNLTGGAGDDSFVIADAGSLTGSIAGGGQTTSDTLNLSAKLGAVSINQQTSTATGIAGTFGGIEAVVGNGVNATLTGVDAGETFNVTAADTGTAGTLAFSGVGNLTGGTGTDSFILSTGTLSGSLNGGTGTNSLTGADVANNWVINATDGGTVTGITGSFSNIGNLNGGTGTDSFVFQSGGILSGPINGGGGSDTLDFSSYGTAVSASPTVAGAGNVSGTPDPIVYAAGDDYTNIESVNTGAGGGLVGPDQVNVWDVTGVNAFTLNGTTYTGISTVTGGSLADTFTIQDGGQLTGATAIDGGTGANSLISVGNATWTLTGGGAGSIATTAGATSFVNIQTLTGGAGNDSFVLNGGTLSGAINGGLGVNTLTADNLANTWVINAADGGTVTGITGGFSNIGNLIGGTNTDSFTLSGGTLSGSIDGGLTGVNTLTADNVANTWTISGADTGTVTGIGGTFSHIANLTGGSNDDAFTVGASGSVSGLIDGGAQVGSDTLDYAAVTAAVTTKIGTNFTNIESVTGDGINDTLVGADVANTWTVNGANAGTVGTVAFNGFSNLTGGTNTDGFTLSAAAH